MALKTEYIEFKNRERIAGETSLVFLSSIVIQLTGLSIFQKHH